MQGNPMLRAILRTFFSGNAGPSRDNPPPANFPLEEISTLNALHERAPLDSHLRILYGGTQISELDLIDLFKGCLADSGTSVSPGKYFIRIQSALNLARYFLYSLEIEGARAECGVFKGFSALLVSKVAAAKLGKFTGAGFHLIDSFAGFAQPRRDDFIPVRLEPGKAAMAPLFGAGGAAVPLEHVAKVLRRYPDISFHKGFIPGVFSDLPEKQWAFVHIDVDLYEPTLASLEYFYPRMKKGGIILCDDYGSRVFPGARKAWGAYCEAIGIPFIVLETGQSVIVNQ